MHQVTPEPTIDLLIEDNIEDTEARLAVTQLKEAPQPHSHSCGDSCHSDHGEDRWIKKIRIPQGQQAPKVGRNDPCSCGSGKKYKKCCLLIVVA